MVGLFSGNDSQHEFLHLTVTEKVIAYGSTFAVIGAFLGIIFEGRRYKIAIKGNQNRYVENKEKLNKFQFKQ